MSGFVEVRGVKIGEGMPKIIVPVLGKTGEEILAAAASAAGSMNKNAENNSGNNSGNIRADLVEWRADWYDDVYEFSKTEQILKELRGIFPKTPILFTFRTAKEGGEKEIGKDDYVKLLIHIARSGLTDLVDVELFTGEETVREIIDAAHAAGVRVVASSHDFDRTPPKEEIIARLLKMQELGADIPKIAVMPRSKRDVLVLLSATEEMVTEYADRPVITMSMARTGLISRLSGEAFGSACTFGTAGKASAPGQMNAADLDTVLRLIHENS